VPGLAAAVQQDHGAARLPGLPEIADQREWTVLELHPCWLIRH
jgi:hypothetical protein